MPLKVVNVAPRCKIIIDTFMCAGMNGNTLPFSGIAHLVTQILCTIYYTERFSHAYAPI